MSFQKLDSSQNGSSEESQESDETENSSEDKNDSYEKTKSSEEIENPRPELVEIKREAEGQESRNVNLKPVLLRKNVTTKNCDKTYT